MTSKVVNSLLIAVLSFYAALGFFTRAQSDDFCELLFTRVKGSIGLPATMYEIWTGRFTLFSLKGVLYGIFDQYLPPLVPALLIICLLISLNYGLRPLFRRGAFTAALTFTVALLTASTNRVQLIYWASGSLMVLTPVIFAAVLVGLILRHKSVVLIAGVAALSVGFNEPFSLVGILLLLFWLIYAPSRWTGTALIGASVGLVIMLIAPGNALRASSATIEQSVPLLQAIVDSGRIYLNYLNHVFHLSPLSWLLPFTLGWWLHPRKLHKNRLRMSVGLLIVALLLGYSTFLIVTWAGVGLGSRHEVVTSVLLLGTSFVIGSWYRNEATSAVQPLKVCAVLILITSVLWIGNQTPHRHQV